MTCVLIENDSLPTYFPQENEKVRQFIEMDEHSIKAL
jgi:hypothetical protein